MGNIIDLSKVYNKPDANSALAELQAQYAKLTPKQYPTPDEFDKIKKYYEFKNSSTNLDNQAADAANSNGALNLAKQIINIGVESQEATGYMASFNDEMIRYKDVAEFINKSKGPTGAIDLDKLKTNIKDAGLKQVGDYFKQQSLLLNEINEGLGLTGILSEQFRENITNASPDLMRLGIGMRDLTDATSALYNTTGKFNLINEETMTRAGEIGKAYLGNIGDLMRMYPEFEKVGFGAADAQEQIATAGRSALKVGLQAKKNLNDINSNLSKLNEYGFSKGVQGLAEMVRRSNEFRISMESVYTIADKVMNPEGALDLAANLQVLGGAIGDFNDPLKLMYMATNDVEGLQKSLIGAASSLATYNTEQGRFEITGVNLRRAKEMASQMGISMQELTKGAIAAAERTSALDDILARGFKMDEEQKELLINMSQMRGGKMSIELQSDSLKQQFGKSFVALDELNQDQIEKILAVQKDFNLSEKELARKQVTQVENIERDLNAVLAIMRIEAGRNVTNLAGEFKKITGLDLDQVVKGSETLYEDANTARNEARKGKTASTGTSSSPTTSANAASGSATAKSATPTPMVASGVFVDITRTSGAKNLNSSAVSASAAPAASVSGSVAQPKATTSTAVVGSATAALPIYTTNEEAMKKQITESGILMTIESADSPLLKSVLNIENIASTKMGGIVTPNNFNNFSNVAFGATNTYGSQQSNVVGGTTPQNLGAARPTVGPTSLLSGYRTRENLLSSNVLKNVSSSTEDQEVKNLVTNNESETLKKFELQRNLRIENPTILGALREQQENLLGKNKLLQGLKTNTDETNINEESLKIKNQTTSSRFFDFSRIETPSIASAYNRQKEKSGSPLFPNLTPYTNVNEEETNNFYRTLNNTTGNNTAFSQGIQNYSNPFSLSQNINNQRTSGINNITNNAMPLAGINFPNEQNNTYRYNTSFLQGFQNLSNPYNLSQNFNDQRTSPFTNIFNTPMTFGKQPIVPQQLVENKAGVEPQANKEVFSSIIQDREIIKILSDTSSLIDRTDEQIKEYRLQNNEFSEKYESSMKLLDLKNYTPNIDLNAGAASTSLKNEQIYNQSYLNSTQELINKFRTINTQADQYFSSPSSINLGNIAPKPPTTEIKGEESEDKKGVTSTGAPLYSPASALGTFGVNPRQVEVQGQPIVSGMLASLVEKTQSAVVEKIKESQTATSETKTTTKEAPPTKQEVLFTLNTRDGASDELGRLVYKNISKYGFREDPKGYVTG